MNGRRLLSALCLLLALGGCASSQPARDEQAATRTAGGSNPELLQKQLELGVGYLRQGDYQRAKEKLNRALDIDPDNATVHATFGLLFQLEGEDDLAEQYFRDAIRYDPESPQARNGYGVFLYDKQRYHEAVKQLAKAAENRFYQNRPAVFENLGFAYLRTGDEAGAEHAFTRAVQLNPEQPRALLELAEMRFEDRNYVEARDFYRRHTRVSPKTAKTLWLCIRLARVFQNYNEEASCAEALEGIFPASDEYRQYKESH